MTQDNLSSPWGGTKSAWPCFMVKLLLFCLSALLCFYIFSILWLYLLFGSWGRLVLQERGYPLGLKNGLLPNTWKWIVWGDTHADKARYLLGRGAWWESRGKETQETCSATWLAISCFMVMRSLFELSLANHSDPWPFLLMSTLLSQSGVQHEGFWEVGRTCGLMSPLYFWPFLNYSGWRWLVSSTFLERTSFCKITCVNGYYLSWSGS